VTGSLLARKAAQAHRGPARPLLPRPRSRGVRQSHHPADPPAAVGRVEGGGAQAQAVVLAGRGRDAAAVRAPPAQGAADRPQEAVDPRGAAGVPRLHPRRPLVPRLARPRGHRHAAVGDLRPARRVGRPRAGGDHGGLEGGVGPQRAVRGRPEAESSIREITIDDTTVQVLREWRQVKRRNRRAAKQAWFESGYEFTDEIGRGIHPTRLSTNFTKALKASGLRHTTPHGLRHLHATLLLDAGVPVKVVSARLGHASTAFTQDHYIKVTEHADHAAALATAHFMTA